MSVVRRTHLNKGGNGGARINTVILTLACGHQRRYPGSSVPKSNSLRCRECEKKEVSRAK